MRDISVYISITNIINTNRRMEGLASFVRGVSSRVGNHYLNVLPLNGLLVYKKNLILNITLTLYPRKGSRGISDITPRQPRFTKTS
jgi:hypothetical protein